MRTVGVIVEYNPFHNGHLYHLQQSLAVTGADAVVAVMSGNFLQRGEPAMFGKRARTEMALAGGCDLVIELPVAYATQAAEWFAYGAVSLLQATGIVDALCFGSENGDLDSLRAIAASLAHEPEAFRLMLRGELDRGASYPSAYSSAVRHYMETIGNQRAASLPLARPNNTLGLHYLLALERLGSSIEPFTIIREKAEYNQSTITDQQIASATAIRSVIAGGGGMEQIAGVIPRSTYTIIARELAAGRKPVSWDNFYSKLFHQLLSQSPQQLSGYYEMSEGLEHRLHQALPVLEKPDFETLIGALKTRRYTRTKLQRVLLSVLLNHQKEQLAPPLLASGIDYIRVLGFTAKGRELLKRMKRTAGVPILLSAARSQGKHRYLELDVRASSLYELAYPDAGPKELFRDYYEPPVIM
ncbi:nucleotidyltransferase [Paenibacillus sp. GCM10012307]|uniref:tRNA(Met) cytidine acetate ligase n=1 Tax=Paenibacillus roseus TaxID=2798579 RepID=A0A934JAL6_9BACL|nr:nucleotidyltransferase [Paenibacillus roseus]MBJ6363335.1 nucleotidyltransferase [Paenibacillus roseus]